MTVRDLLMDKSHCTCKWFSGSRLEDGHFPEDALTVPATDNKEKVS